MDEVIKASEDALKFCHERGLDDRSSIIASLAIEELARNIIEETGHDQLARHQHIDVHVVAKNGLTIRVRNNCPDFDTKNVWTSLYRQTISATSVSACFAEWHLP
ncbi:MAG: hypothetical protein IKS32_02560 [Solobacterium sp.]|nr:hypothetical protein [Solobacterium sp.]